MTNIERFHGSSMEDVLKELGKTDMCESFLMEEAIGEFRVELHNIYPLNNPENRTVRISELSWQDGDYMITLWFHNVNDTWVVLDSRRWHKDTDF